VCARYAGDEFVLVLGECDEAQAERRRVDLQQAIASLWVELVPGRVVRLSVSIGASTFPNDAETVEEIIRAADQRMYQDTGRPEAAHGATALAGSRIGTARPGAHPLLPRSPYRACAADPARAHGILLLS